MLKRVLNVIPRKIIKRCSSTNTSTVDPGEIAVFNKLSQEWWNEFGEFKPLHSMNTLRIPFIRNGLINSGRISEDAGSNLLSLKGVKILDVGCGGGILSEPLARIGATVVGLDASSEAIKIANEHSELDCTLKNNLTYIHGTLEELNLNDFDVVIASEVLEHMNSARHCIELCAKLLKPGGSLFITTLNRSLFSWLGGIVVAEYILKIVPPGTHDWNKFITPKELKIYVEDNNCDVNLIHGMNYNLSSNKWSWCGLPAINYALHAIKSRNV